ncbi:HEAT repeat domain-containing protein [Candidatus Uabimicrobium sp. HlEnr_7]|uniref:HEAT repeat domain-containing protein n=1 Tax=Candidatus Uabimicrobium helgolandensis TaxID=3095367 RepID=UPI00355747C8
MRNNCIIITIFILFFICCDTSHAQNSWEKRYHNAHIDPQKYISDPHYLVRGRTLASPNIKIEDLQILMNDSSWYVRSKVAECKMATAEILSFLAKDKNFHVRKSVAENDNTPSSVLSILALDERWQVKFSVIESKSIPISILYFWSTSESHFTKKESMYRLAHKFSLFKKLIDFINEKQEVEMADKICAEIAAYSSVDPKILEFLADHRSWEVRLEVAQNSKTPINCLQKLATDEDDSIRTEVVSNSSTTIKILQDMASCEKDEDIKEEIEEILNENLSGESND